jgi:hypothetical protein
MHILSSAQGPIGPVRRGRQHGGGTTRRANCVGTWCRASTAAYRAVLVQSVPALSRLDGIDVAKERGRLAQKLESVGQTASELGVELQPRRAVVEGIVQRGRRGR